MKSTKKIIIFLLLLFIFNLGVIYASSTNFNNVPVYKLMGWDLGEIPSGTKTVTGNHADVTISSMTNVSEVQFYVAANGAQWGKCQVIKKNTDLGSQIAVNYSSNVTAGTGTMNKYRNAHNSMTIGRMSGNINY